MFHTDDLLRDLHRSNRLDDLDLHLAEFLLAQATRPSQSLALAIALTTHATSEGHVCLDLKAIADESVFSTSDRVVRAPGLQTWRRELLESGVVGHPGEWQPLILDGSDRLYLHRYWDYEQRLGQGLLRRAEAVPGSIDLGLLKAGLQTLFRPPSGQGTDWQKIAAASAVLHRLCVISGGPGTGKTTIVVRLLALLRQQPGGDGLRIALAAPTGMAASRLQQAIRQSKASLPLSARQLRAIPEEASTLHRLLGVCRHGTGFRHHRENPLLLDAVIVDEASMVDVALMAKLLDALPEQARLILLGDRDQLASVEAGAVLGDICVGCEGPDRPFARRLEQITGQAVDVVTKSAGRLSNSVVLLRQSYRFDADSRIGQLARAVNQGDAQAALALLRGREAEGIGWLAPETSTASVAASRYAALFRQLAAGASADRLFSTLYDFRLLCAVREGPYGVKQLNQAITRELIQAGHVADNREWYPGRPVMLTRNDYQLNLYNGETGIVLPHPDSAGELAVAFRGTDGEIRWVSHAALPHCETVYALTVHKSQGSEFRDVMLQLPDQPAAVLCRELLYTAVTRSKQRFTLVGMESVLAHTVARRLKRASGLADLLDV
ncbi:MAG: exodeoxyribonuclease V subunit alpha [Candidatus Thiodiazotropha sp. (ex Dulcina madagascariensis)]|nr:exodeoxyribonuclease V subunit alpha [Candidatus Thiodiazotropha sp. (ex Dulcina madagascariensis)]MCU7925340.1 exodeoxyribonuclease V subunit alpha [Candidatus Thiodiazotropha sp. (ex Dulcina madagascariensis)]